jgi:hypothetical protein
MFKRIRSDRDPEVTLFGEVRKEFAVSFSGLWSGFREFLLRWPRLSFGLMIFLMLFSMVFSFVVLRPAGKPVPAVSSGMAPVRKGFGELMDHGKAINRTLSLKREIELMLAKDSLSAADSVRMEAAIDELHKLSISTADPGVR